MGIVSSVVTPDNHTQANGRRYITEQHTDSVGAVHPVTYLAINGSNYQAAANARGLKIAESLAEAEFTAVING